VAAFTLLADDTFADERVEATANIRAPESKIFGKIGGRKGRRTQIIAYADRQRYQEFFKHRAEVLAREPLRIATKHATVKRPTIADCL
jgi:hypothetical protein